MTAENVSGLLKDEAETVDYEYMLKNFVGTMGKWQIRIIVIFLLIKAGPYFMFGTFGNYMSHHYCRVAPLEFTNWTVEEKRNFSIPEKPFHENPMPGQSYEPCRRYKLPYNEMGNLTFEEALEKRDNILGFKINDTNKMESCKDGWIFDTRESDFAYSIITDFNLVCENSVLEPLSNSMYFLGMMVGSAPWGAIADRIGRRKVVLYCNICVLLVGMGTSVAPNYPIFLILRFLTAIFSNGIDTAFTVLVMEIISSRQRNLTGLYTCLDSFITNAYLVGIAYATRNWRIFNLFIATGPCFIFLIYFIDESPRWLLAVGRKEESVKILRKASKMNSKKQWPDEINLDSVKTETESKRRQSFRKTVTDVMMEFIKLVQTKEMRKRSLILFFIWSAASGIYFGFFFYNVKLQGNVFIIVLLGVLTGIPANLIQVISYEKIGRRTPLSACLMLCAVCSVAMGIIIIVQQYTKQEFVILLITLGTLATLFANTSYEMLNIYTPELMPTVVRTCGLGSCAAVAKISAILSPFINQLRDRGYPHIPMFMYGTVAFTASLLCLLLPETRNKKMPETIVEVESSKKNEREIRNIETELTEFL